MKKMINALVLGLVLLCATSCAYERIDAGYEGIKVNLYGDSKGVDNVELVTGAVWYSPVTTAVYEYPTFVQTIDYPAFSVNANDGSSFAVDPTISLKIIDGTAPQVFKKYRKDNLLEIANTTLYNYVKNAFRIELNKYSTDELVSKREEFEKAIETRLANELKSENFHLEQMTSGLKYPNTLVEAINAKNAAVQKAQKAQNEVLQIEAEAQKKVAAAKGVADARIAEAEGEAKAMRIKADAEAYYNRTISASLSPMIVQEDWIEKWDGHLPTYSGGGTPLIQLPK